MVVCVGGIRSGFQEGEKERDGEGKGRMKEERDGVVCVLGKGRKRQCSGL